MNKEIITTHRVDHLPMVAQFIEDIGLIDIIDGIVDVHPNEILSTGQTAAAIVTMALCFVSRPLYLSPQFFKSKALKLIIGKSKTGKTEEILPEHFNDDKLGRTLDEIYDLGPDTLFQTIAFAAARKEKLTVPSLHLDTTSHSFYGEYEGNLAKGITNKADSTEPCHATIAYGFSKDKRNDCKQLVQELLVSSDGDVPLMVKIHSGNESDVKIFQERVKQIKEHFINADDLMPEYIVADSKFYNKTNIEAANKEEFPRWITRVPDNIIEARDGFSSAYDKGNWIEIKVGNGKDVIRYSEIKINRDNIAQRFIVVISDSGLHRAEKTVERHIKKELLQLEASVKKLSKKEFFSEQDAKNALDELFQKKQYHLLNDTAIKKSIKHAKKGRPSNDDIGKDIFHIIGTIKTISQEDILKNIWQKASFIIGTNDLNGDVDKIISIYRKDQQGVERAFRFLKSPTYFADAFFFKNTKRLVSLLTLMTISLLIYSLLQRKLRKAIEFNNKAIPDQKGKPTKRPTMNWVNQCFEGIDVITQGTGLNSKYTFVRVDYFVQQVLQLLGEQYVFRYSIKMLM